MKTKLIAAALAATVLAGGVALAQNPTHSTATPETPPPHGGMFTRADANHDGVVTRDELVAIVDQHFAKIDANHDGKITAEERQTVHGRMGGGRGGRRMHRPDGPGAPGGPEGSRGPGHGLHVDADSDGVVTLDEARAPALKAFAYLDRNNDGQIDKAERESFRDAAMAFHGPGGPRSHGRHGGHDRHGGHHGRHGPPPADAPDAPQAQ